MILLDRVAEVTIALLITLIFVIMVFSIFFNATLATVEQRINNLSVECSDSPSSNAIVVDLGDLTVYCLVSMRGDEFKYPANPNN